MTTRTISFVSNTITNPISRFLPKDKCNHCDINTVAQVLSSVITENYIVILLDINYYAQDGYLNNASLDRLDELQSLLQIFRKHNNAKVILSNVAGNFLEINSALSLKQQQILLTLNKKIDSLTAISDIAILNIYQMVNYIGFKHFYNIRNGFLFQTPWTKTAFIEIANSITEKIHLFNINRKKLLILDADNTLWGGIIGEDGIDNINIDQNYPGICYRFFQQQLKYLQSSGILLALVSKNNFVDVREIFYKKNMPLKWNDFIIKKINWQPKSHNIKEVVNELNISLDSVIFFDDSDFELAEVEQNLGIKTVRISFDNPIENLNLLHNIPELKSLSISLEDKQKTLQYQTQITRKEVQNTFDSIEGYLCSIQMQLSYSINNLQQIKRITQLINKTNQFNLTTKRYSESEVQTMMGYHQVLSFSLQDKFGDLGLVAVMIIKNNDIDTFLMSCRVLGRGLEKKILHIVIKNREIPLTASYVKSHKNIQTSSFYDDFAISIDRVDNDTKKYKLSTKVENIYYIKENKL